MSTQIPTKERDGGVDTTPRRIAPEGVDDRALVDGILRGEDRVEELMRRHNQRVYRMARMILRDDMEAQDVAQEAWLRALQNLEGFEGRAQFSTWLLRIAYHEALACQRRASRRVDVSPSSPVFDAPMDREAPENPEHELSRRRLAASLEAAVESLPEKLRVTYLLRDIEGQSTRESAESLGVSVTAVKVRLHRARNRLREQLSASGAIDPEQIFPFGFERCDRMVAGVLARLQGPREPRSPAQPGGREH